MPSNWRSSGASTCMYSGPDTSVPTSHHRVVTAVSSFPVEISKRTGIPNQPDISPLLATLSRSITGAGDMLSGRLGPGGEENGAVKRMVLASGDGMRLEAAVHRHAGAAAGAVVLAHGITVDMDEGGMFVSLADRLSEAGFGVLRFSFRGHGGSAGTQT